VSSWESEHRLNQLISVSDGRRLGFAEYGDPSGRPVLFFPGTPSGRLFHHPDESIALSLGARIITIDRPGFGLSDFQEGRTVLDWPDDVTALAGTLGLDRLAVVGLSGGAPYVAACAFKIPERLSAAGIVSGVGPTDWPGATEGMQRRRRLGATVARNVPCLVRPLLWRLSNPHRDGEKYFDRIQAQSSERDQGILSQRDVKAMLIENWMEATRAGLRGYAWETVIFSRPWGFSLESISMEVHLWHGDDDASIPLSVGQHVAGAIPSCRATTLAGEGHFLFFDHWRDILAAMVS
jgi:pimeloyl-ACP methyl ester carboxylesterase